MDQRIPHNIPVLDGWRAVAIGCLYVGHFFPVPGINLGAVGVHLFFVLSGLLMARILFVRPVPIPVFYKRRVARVFPSLYFYIGGIACVYWATGMPTSWHEIAAAETFVINYFPGPRGGAVMPLGHVWSLCVEEHSYVLLSLVALGHRAGKLQARRTVGLLALLWAACGLAYWSAYPHEHLKFDRWLHSEVSAFGIFASAWLLLWMDARKLRQAGPWMFMLLVVVGFAAHWWSVALPVTAVFGTGAFALAVNIVERAPRVLRWVLSLAPVRQVGLWSFSLYLWQQPFYLMVWRRGLPAWEGALLAAATGIVAYYLLERPARAALNRGWGAPDRNRVEPIDGLSAYGEVAS